MTTLNTTTNSKGVTLSAGETTQPKPTRKDRRAAASTKTKGVKADIPETDKPVKVAKPATVKAAKTPKLPKATPVTAEPALGPDGQPLEKVRRSIVPMKFKERYSKTGGTCGDDMALELKAATTTRNADKREVLDVEALWAIAKANAIDVAKYVDLNNGQKRMNVGNKLRGKLAQGADVVIGKRTFKAEDWEPRT